MLVYCNANPSAAYKNHQDKKDDYRKLGAFFTNVTWQFAHSTKQSFLFAVKVNTGTRGNCQSVEFSESTPEVLKSSLKKIASLDVNWLELIREPGKRNYSLIIPVLVIVEKVNGTASFGASEGLLDDAFTFAGKALLNGGKIGESRIITPVRIKYYDGNLEEKPVTRDDLIE